MRAAVSILLLVTYVQATVPSTQKLGDFTVLVLSIYFFRALHHSHSIFRWEKHLGIYLSSKFFRRTSTMLGPLHKGQHSRRSIPSTVSLDPSNMAILLFSPSLQAHRPSRPATAPIASAFALRLPGYGQTVMTVPFGLLHVTPRRHDTAPGRGRAGASFEEGRTPALYTRYGMYTGLGT